MDHYPGYKKQRGFQRHYDAEFDWDLDLPISCDPAASKILLPSLAGTPTISKPTLRRLGPFASSSKIRDLPGNGAASGARRSLPEGQRHNVSSCEYDPSRVDEVALRGRGREQIPRLPITQLRPASTGETLSSKSCPYRHMPASSLKLSLAPRPMSCTSGWAAMRSVIDAADEGGMEICVGVSIQRRIEQEDDAIRESR